MVKPAGTGRPAFVISARPAPLPPRRSRIFALPSAFLFAKRYTHFCAFGAARRGAALRVRLRTAMADLPFGDIDSRRNGRSGEPAKCIAARRPESAPERQDDHDEDRTGRDARRFRRVGEGVAELEDDYRSEQASPQRSDATEDG